MKNLRHSRKVTAALGLFAAVALWLAPAAFANNTFTVGVIPDTQFYVDSGNLLTTSPAYTQPTADDTAKYFQAETQWFVNNKTALNLAFVTHVGDVVQNGDGTSDGTTPLSIFPASAEYDRAFSAMQILANAGIPFGMTPGNHDYDNYYWKNNSRPLIATNMWPKYFGSQSSLFKGQPWYGGASDSLSYNPGISSWQTFTAGGRKFLHISLELEASNTTIAWAQNVINAHKGYATIITTHSYMSPFAAGSMQPPATQGGVNATYNASSAYSAGSPVGGNGGQGIFTQLVYPNDQVFLVICGHSYNGTNLAGAFPGSSQGEAIRIDNNAAGHPVYQVLSDFQDNMMNHDLSPLPTTFAIPPYAHAPGAAHSVPYVSGVSDPGGDGWLRLMTFDLTSGNIHFWTYSPLLENGQGVPGRYAGQCPDGNKSGTTCTCTTTPGGTCENTFEQPSAYSDFSWGLPMPVQVLNAASQFNFTSTGLVYNRATKTYTGNLTVTNTGAAYPGPINVALNNLTAGVTLTDATASYNGAPSVTASATGLAANASITVPLTFSDPANAVINFTPMMY